MSKKSKVLGIIIIIIIIFTLVGTRNAKGETIDIPQIPEPGQSWEDYNSQHPLPDVWPSPTPEPTPSQQPGGMLMATRPYNRARWRGWRLFGSATTPGTYAYQKLTYPYSEVTTPPGFSAINRTANEAGTAWVYSTSGVSGGSVVLNSSNSILNLIDTYVYSNMVIYYSDFSAGPVVGQGLDFGYEGAFYLKWDVDAYVRDTNQLITDFPIMVAAQVRYDDGTYNWIYDVAGSDLNVTSLKNGVGFSIKSDRDGRKIYFVSIHLFIGMSGEYWQNYPWNQPGVRSSGDATIFLLRSNSDMTVETTTYEMETSNKTIWQAILDLPSAIGRIFVPSQTDFQSWIQGKVDSQPGDSSTMLYYQAFLQILNTVGNYTQEEVHFKIPPLKIRVQGINYQYFDGIDYNFADADIQLEGQAHTLFFYSRLVGDVLIVSGFVFGFLYKMWKRVFDVSYAAGMEAYDVEELQW